MVVHMGMVFIVIVMLLVAAPTSAQTAAQPPAKTCEQQLDEAQRIILKLRRDNAQGEYTNAALQEALMDERAKQKQAVMPASSKAAEKK